MRFDTNGKYTNQLSNLPQEASLSQLAWYKCQRYFIVRSHQDVKSELGWDELFAAKYRAWEHPESFNYLSELVHCSKIVPILPALSVANGSDLLRSVMPLRQLTPQKAVEQVVEQERYRTHSRKTRIKAQEAAYNAEYG